MKAWHLLASALAGIALTLAVTGFAKPVRDDANVDDNVGDNIGDNIGDNVGDKWDLVCAEVLTVSEMDLLAAGEPVFYQGSMDRWHYFRVGSSGYYRLRQAETTIPTHGFDGDGASQLAGVFMTLTIENGKLRASDLATGSMGLAKRNRALTIPTSESQGGG